MKSIQIQYFLDLALTLNFTETANHFYVSQPAISKQIIALEQELGVLLFERTKKSVQLTPAGKLYFQYFQDASKGFEETKRAVGALSRSTRKHFTVSLLNAWNVSTYLPKIIAQFKTLYPDVLLTFENHTFTTMDSLLHEGQTDLVITLIQPDRMRKHYCHKVITDIPSLLFFSKNHPLSRKKRLCIQDFYREDFIIYSDQTAQYSRNLMKDMLAPYGFTPNVVVVPNVESMILKVEAGQGVAFFDDWIRYKSNPNLKFIKTDMMRTVQAIWLKAHEDEMLLKFIEVFTQIVKPDAS